MSCGPWILLSMRLFYSVLFSNGSNGLSRLSELILELSLSFSILSSAPLSC